MEGSRKRIAVAYLRVATKEQLSTPKGGPSYEQIRQISNGYPGQYQSNQPFAHRLAAETAAAEKAAAEEKAMANTRLLEEIRDLLKNR